MLSVLTLPLGNVEASSEGDNGTHNSNRSGCRSHIELRVQDRQANLEGCMRSSANTVRYAYTHITAGCLCIATQLLIWVQRGVGSDLYLEVHG